MTTAQDLAIQDGSTNVYTDLGYPDDQDMLVKAGLAHEIAQIIRSRHLTQQRAADLLGMPQPKLSDMLRGRFRGISQAEMVDWLNQLGRCAAIQAATPQPDESPQKTAAFLRAIADGWGDDIPDDIDDADLGVDSPRDPL